MRFFVPGACKPEETALIYDYLRSCAQTITLRVTDQKIASVLYKRMGKLYHMEVGSPDPIRGEIVIAIIEATLWYVIFTLNRGVARGEPYLVKDEEVLSVIEFEG